MQIQERKSRKKQREEIKIQRRKASMTQGALNEPTATLVKLKRRIFRIEESLSALSTKLLSAKTLTSITTTNPGIIARKLEGSAAPFRTASGVSRMNATQLVRKLTNRNEPMTNRNETLLPFKLS